MPSHKSSLPPCCAETGSLIHLQAETRLAIAMVVSSFRVEADQRLKARTPEEFAQACTALVTLCPRQGAWLQLTPRVKL